jgi:hypothetical protein
MPCATGFPGPRHGHVVTRTHLWVHLFRTTRDQNIERQTKCPGSPRRTSSTSTTISTLTYADVCCIRVLTYAVRYNLGQRCGDIELAACLADAVGSASKPRHGSATPTSVGGVALTLYLISTSTINFLLT